MAYELTAEEKKIAMEACHKGWQSSNESYTARLFAACAAVLESATEPGAALSDAEWKAVCYLVVWEAISPEPAIFVRKHIDAILAKRRVLKGATAPQSAPAPAQAKGVIERLSAPVAKTRIRTSFVNPPIPVRHFDWVAWIDGNEENGLHGHGRNESEAINELMNLHSPRA